MTTHRPKDLAKLLGMHYITVYRLIKDGKIPAVRIGRGLFVSDEYVQNVLQAKKDGAA